jgi:hypothetical protein
MGARGLSAGGGKLAQAACGMQGEAAAPISSQAMTRGLAVLHTQRALERVLQRQWTQAERQRATARQAATKVARYKRQGRAPRGVSGVAGRAWAPGREAPRSGGERPRGRASDSSRSVMV